MNSWQKQHPPYEGTEPYLYFAFADADARRVWPLLRLLLRRGCRVWYAAGRAGGAAELVRRQKRTADAALSLVWLTDAAREDADLKSALLTNQSAGRPILCLDADEGDGGLSMGLYESTPHLPAGASVSPADLETMVVRAPGFTQELLGEPQTVRESGLAGRIIPALLVLAALLLAAAFLFLRAQKPADSLVFHDPILREAVREAVGGGPVSEENAAAVTFLRFDELPDSWEELALLPALEKLELPQSTVRDGPLPDGDYVLVLGRG